MRLCTGAFRTSPTVSILATASELPLSYRRKELVTKYTIKAQQNITNRVSDCVRINQEDNRDYPRRRRPIRERAKEYMRELQIPSPPPATGKLPDAPPWERWNPKVNLSLSKYPLENTSPQIFKQLQLEMENTMYRDHKKFYTDGSVCNGKSGFAIFSSSNTTRVRMPNGSSIFTCEAKAILKCLELVEKGPAEERIAILSDSLSCVKAIKSRKNKNTTVVQVQRKLRELHAREVELIWIPGHKGIAGNVSADLAAKKATNVDQGPKMTLSVEDAMRQCREATIGLWDGFWRSQPQKLNKIRRSTSEKLPVQELPRNLEPFISTLFIVKLDNKRSAISNNLEENADGPGYFARDTQPLLSAPVPTSYTERQISSGSPQAVGGHTSGLHRPRLSSTSSIRLPYPPLRLGSTYNSGILDRLAAGGLLHQSQHRRFSNAHLHQRSGVNTSVGQNRHSIGYLPIEEENFHPISQRSSIILPHLQDWEKHFFELVADGNVENVKKFLNENSGFNINCVNFQGLSALHVAMESRSEPMVTYLLQLPQIDVTDCALHAVRENQIRFVTLILDRLRATSPELEFVGCTHSTEFPEYITPLILAAQSGHYEIIEMLLQRGHNLEPPHPPNCRCRECQIQMDSDDLLHSSAARLNLYRAIANPAFICHTSNDPVLTAFLISTELKARASCEPEFRSAYLTLATEVSQFAVELIAQCRSAEEVELLLKQISRQDSGFGGPFPRLALAMNLKQKEFVAHPNCQMVLTNLWLGDWRNWSRFSLHTRIFLLFPRVFMLPIITLMCVFLPSHSLVRRWNSPVSKFVSHLSAYFSFLIIIFLESNMSKTNQKRGPPNSGLEPVIIVYVIGYVWSCVRLCIIQGPSRYFHALFNVNDVIMLTLFISTFMFWLAALVDVQINDQETLERKYWHHLDPILIAEGLFAVAVILAYFRLMFLCQLNYTLGPLQISLGKMSADIAKYIVIFTIIIVAFTAGLARLYHYYAGMIQTDEESGIKTVQESSFINVESTLKTLFWALFCMSPIESADVIIENLPGETESTTVINKHIFTETIGYIAFACFEVISVIVILNMLIATMSNTFQRVTDNVDVEWTFGRTGVYLDYMAQTTLPSPFNLIPTASGAMSIVEWCRGGARCSSVMKPVQDPQSSREFPVLMALLVQRYFRDHDNNEQQNDIDALRNEILELKSSLRK